VRDGKMLHPLVWRNEWESHAKEAHINNYLHRYL